MRKIVRNLIKISPVLVLGGVLFSLIYLVPRIVKISEIVCESQFGPCEDDIKNKLSDFADLSLYGAKDKANGYLSDRPSISKFAMRFLFPDKLKVELIQSKPKSALYNGRGQFALIDKQGLVLSYQAETLLPYINIEDSPPSVGEKVEGDLAFALRILEYMNNLFGAKEGKVEDSGVVFKLAGGQGVIFPLVGDAEVLVGRAILINSRLNKEALISRMEGAGGLEGCNAGCAIDLRFKNPVVRI